uniref:Retrovirus-related Pol polyprotein from transposon 17.6 n=1 Tax=Cajanus cajan TaxID=3821 RepID=A0A151RGJ2_CAJCA|nr:Retrovirus-related Pol polyprotein from transposon 17.6 [Cajanus cajan]
MCKVFPTSLKGPALNWFTRLPSGSIDSFTTVSSRFTIQFATSRPHQLTSIALVNIRQEKKEPLRAFMERYSTWLANVVMVKKSNGKWRMCTDYTDLNKACPKDAYPLPHIDALVDGAAGHFRLSFLDAYSGYNQIPMYPPDEAKAAFITDSANYCYKVMPFGLKNAGATYQRLMDKIFCNQIGTSLEVYVDDMVIKSASGPDHIRDLCSIFDEVRCHHMRLNPAKCTFGVAGGKFLGFILSQRGIEANPDKCQAIINMKTFNSFKAILATPPLLIKPDPQLDMIMYISVSDKAISTVLVQEKTEQMPIYFISRVLQDAETRYQHLEKTVLALVHTSRRLRHYFQSHRMLVRTDTPITKVLRKPELAGRMVSWSIELSQFDIRFKPRGPIKAQSLADFLNEFTSTVNPDAHLWTLHVDGSSNQQGSGAGIILEGPGHVVVEQSLRFGFKASNNQAEYEALLAGLRLAKDLGISRIQCWSDSQVVIGQFQIKEPTLLLYFHAFNKLKADFEDVQVKHTPRELNVRADQLARLASSKKVSHLRSVIQQDLPKPSIAKPECLQVQPESPDWMTGIKGYLTAGILPDDPLEAKKMRITAARYTLIAGDLYKRGFSTPLLKCLTPDQAHYVLREIHEGVCGTHSGGRTLAAKVLRAGYYWPTLVANCSNFIQRCKPCQQHGPLTHQPPEGLHAIATPWPFSIWGMDILGPFPPAKGQVKFLVVAVDHFTKWIEAEALATITANNIQKFFWKNVVTRFGIPSTKETPFRLTYGTDAMIPVEVGEPSLRRTQFDEDSNRETLNVEMDLVDEAREQALVNMEACRTRLAKKIRTKVKPREFQAGDLVWRVTGEARKDKAQGKLAPNWDSPFRIMHNLKNGAYKLEELSGKAIPRTWNATHLKHYFS